MSDTTQVLQRVFAGLEGTDLKTLSDVVVRRHVSADTVICQEGEIEHEFYILNKGTVAITQQLGREERFLAAMGSGEFFGEMALLEHKPRVATVRALEESELLVITEETFGKVVARNPVVALTILRQISKSLRRTDHQIIEDLQAKNAQLRQAFRELREAQAELVEKQRLERELEIAAEVQRSILPTQFPELRGFSFAARARPARWVGGDFYDIRLVDRHRLGVLLADVSGKSIDAAIFMAVTRSLFLTEARHTASPGEVLSRVHDLLLEIGGAKGMFVTAFYAVIDTTNGSVRYARAGHDPPLHYRQGRVHTLTSAGRFLGLFDAFQVEEKALQLLPGDLLVLYSDGVTDALNSADEQYGVERVRHIVQKHAIRGAQVVCDAIFDDVLSFTGNTSQFDDITLQIIEFNPDET